MAGIKEISASKLERLMPVTFALLMLLYVAVAGCTDGNSLEEIKESGTIRVLTRNNAHCYHIYREKKMGFEYDLAREFAEYLGGGLENRHPVLGRSH